LKDGQLLELAHGFIIDGVAFLKRHYGREDGTSNDVDSNDDNSSADNHSLLGGIVVEPVFTVRLRVRDFNTILFFSVTILIYFCELCKFNFISL